MASTTRLDIQILLDTLATAARGEPIDPEICETVERIARDHTADFSPDDIQALYDCGPTDAAPVAPPGA